MTARSLARILIRVWAVVLLVTALLGLPAMVGQLFVQNPGNDPSWRLVGVWNLMYLLLSGIIAAALLVYAEAIARRISDGEPESEPDSVHSSIEAVAFGCVGLYFAIRGIRECAGLLFQLATKPAYERENLAYLWRNAPNNLVAAAVQTAAGVALFFGRRGLAGVWGVLRTNKFTQTSPEKDEDTTPES